ncbi:MAG: corrinoid protein [Candidatus Marinimicrobia bacterium]|jgi:5-methyltetrahydrofolate--homocysteine methyltransferase|nr:corrinoid protein [Candidatus Neomarinimicrobiota bacterium]MCK9484033.1 corrinoid protein [Candidatus Neomarinimicrobiota bacterium]MCK9560090.1 corrinoid protein [Candidatus Neomarinimicrobiota bacterium]
MTRNQELYQAILRGDRSTVQKIFQSAIDQHADVNELLEDSMIPAMREVGERFARSEIYVPEMLIAARAMQAGLTLIEPILAKSNRKPRGKVAVGTVKGDLHDIGKNLVVIMLKGAGYEVLDLGINCPVEKYATAAAAGINIIMCSALLSTTMMYMKEVVNFFKNNSAVKIIVGGAPVTQKYADSIGAHGYGKNANEAVRIVERLTGAVA